MEFSFKNIKIPFIHIFILYVLWYFVFFFSPIQAQIVLTNSNGYLPYREDGNWTNYPYAPTINNIKPYLNKRYCSDIKVRKMNPGDFYREENDEIKYKIISTISNGKCKTLTLKTEDVADASGEIAIKTTTYENKTNDTQCQQIVKEPLIFPGDIFIDTNGVKTTIARDAVLFSPDASDCYFKSCIDLTYYEYEAIYNTIHTKKYSKSNKKNENDMVIYEYEGNSTIKTNYKNFCSHYEYDGIYTGGGITNIKYIINKKKPTPAYCNQIIDYNSFKYVIPEGGASDSNGNTLSDVYNCSIHQCPLNNKSLTCWTNYYLFFEKDDNGELIRKANYISEYEEWILYRNSIGEKCVPVECSKRLIYDPNKRACTSKNGKYILASECSEYNSIDDGLELYYMKNYPDTYSEKLKVIRDFYGKQNCEASDYNSEIRECIRHVDCGLKENEKNEYSYLCVDTVEEDSTENLNPDNTFSSFYRPVPPPYLTEVLDDYAMSSSIKDGVGPIHAKGVFIKRILAGKSDLNPIDDPSNVNHPYSFGIGDADRLNSFVSKETFVYDEPSPSGKSWGTYLTYEGRANKVSNFFINSPVTPDWKNVAAPSHQAFKNYGYRTKKTSAWFPIIGRQTIYKSDDGEFFNGFFGTTTYDAPNLVKREQGHNASGLFKTAHLAFGQLCNDSRVCGDSPDWDSIYIRGDPIFTWSTKHPTVDKVSVVVCLRTEPNDFMGPWVHNCGSRQCSLECLFSGCSRNVCGADHCVKLSMDILNGANCTLSNLKKIEDAGKKWKDQSCAAEFKGFDGHLRARLTQTFGNKFYVVLDRYSSRNDCTFAANYDFWNVRGNVYDNDTHGLKKVKEGYSTYPRYVEINDKWSPYETKVERWPTEANIDEKKYESFLFSSSSLKEQIKPASLSSRKIGGQFKGRLSYYSLYNYDLLEDVDGDGYITDYDVLGEYLYWYWRCDLMAKRSDTEYNEKATEVSTKHTDYEDCMSQNNNEEDKCEDFILSDEEQKIFEELSIAPDNRCQTYMMKDSHNREEERDKIGAHNSGYNFWYPIQVVQYIGNNQPVPVYSSEQSDDKEGQQNNKYIGGGHWGRGVWEFGKCKVGQVRNCRGFYDAKGVFHREQQGFLVPLSTSPMPYFKYATRENMPSLFLPLLIIQAYYDLGMNRILYNESNADTAIVDFFEPRIDIIFGSNKKTIALNFNETQTTKDSYGGQNIQTDYLGETLTAIYSLKKLATMEPSAKVCLYQVVLTSNALLNAEQQIACLKRYNPNIANFMIKPYDIQSTPALFKAYFHKNSFDNMKVGDKIMGNIDDKNNFIPFYKEEGLENLGEEYTRLQSEAYAFGQNYPIMIKNDLCSELHYSCVEKKRLLNLELAEYEQNTDKIQEYTSYVEYCEKILEVYCDNLNGNPSLIQKIKINNDNTISKYIYKIRDNYRANGSYNQACVVSGFDDYIGKTVSQISTAKYRGKCVLTDESKKNKDCRRKEYYEFCDKLGEVDANGNICKCLNEIENCDCKESGSCLRVINCDCEGDDCLKLKESCFMPGINYHKTLFTKDNKLDSVCSCDITGLDVGTTTNSNTLEVRNFTEREMGLCVNLEDIKFCDAIKYYDKDKEYHEGGEGNKLNVIQKTYYSNIWRTQQKIYGKYFFNNLGHAEFDKSNDCSTLRGEYTDPRCLLLEKCFDEVTGKSCSKPGKDCSKDKTCTDAQKRCKCKYAQTGSCVGFWKQSDINTIPIAECETQTIDGEEFTMYKFVPQTRCVRYACPTINDTDAILYSEIEASNNIAETDGTSINRQGYFHGFATWEEYRKGSDLEHINETNAFYDCLEGYDIDSNGHLKLDTKGRLKCKNTRIFKDNEEEGIKDARYVENGYGDDIEERVANYCLQGFGPAGTNYILDMYIPYINGDDLEFKIRLEDGIVKDMLNFYKKNTEVNKEYAKKTNYDAQLHLPRRYCSQVGEWLSVEDIYTKYSFDLYHIKNTDLKDTNEFGIIKTTNAKFNGGAEEVNQYGETIDYRSRYCERLYCPKIDVGKIGLLSVESSEPEVGSYKTYSNGSENNRYYPNVAGYMNYPKVVNNYQDNRVNFLVVNKETPWRKAGGAIWEETPAIRNYNKSYVGVNGTCVESLNFYPYDTKFIGRNIEKADGTLFYQPTFQDQYDSVIFNTHASGYKVDLKSNSLKTENSPATQPIRNCSKWGQWQEIEDSCVATCEPIDPFRTNYRDTNGTKYLENYEITQLYKTPINIYATSSDIGFTQKDENGNFVNITYTDTNKTSKVRYGDIYTGGAKWPRVKAGTVVVGECDATIGRTYTADEVRQIKNKNPNLQIQPSTQYVGFPKAGIQFVRAGTKENITVKVPQYLKDAETVGTLSQEDNSDGSSLDIGRPYKNVTINTNSRPYRVCHLDGTWGPVINPCINFVTCQDELVSNSTFVDKSSIRTGGDYDYNIGTAEGGSVTFEEATEHQEDPSYILDANTLNCNNGNNTKYFKNDGTFTKKCDITTGLWIEDATESTCELKTCPSLKLVVGSSIETNPITKETNVMIDLPADKYYPKSSGLEGKIDLKYGVGLKEIKQYIGYEVYASCPKGYYCAYCDKKPKGTYDSRTGQYTTKDMYMVRYTCDLNSNDNAEWTTDLKNGAYSHCVPYTCNVNGFYNGSSEVIKTVVNSIKNYADNTSGNPYGKNTSYLYKEGKYFGTILSSNTTSMTVSTLLNKGIPSENAPVNYLSRVIDINNNNNSLVVNLNTANCSTNNSVKTPSKSYACLVGNTTGNNTYNNGTGIVSLGHAFELDCNSGFETDRKDSDPKKQYDPYLVCSLPNPATFETLYGQGFTGNSNDGNNGTEINFLRIYGARWEVKGGYCAGGCKQTSETKSDSKIIKSAYVKATKLRVWTEYKKVCEPKPNRTYTQKELIKLERITSKWECGNMRGQWVEKEVNNYISLNDASCPKTNNLNECVNKYTGEVYKINGVPIKLFSSLSYNNIETLSDLSVVGYVSNIVYTYTTPTVSGTANVVKDKFGQNWETSDSVKYSYSTTYKVSCNSGCNTGCEKTTEYTCTPGSWIFSKVVIETNSGTNTKCTRSCRGSINEYHARYSTEKCGGSLSGEYCTSTEGSTTYKASCRSGKCGYTQCLEANHRNSNAFGKTGGNCNASNVLGLRAFKMPSIYFNLDHGSSATSDDVCTTVLLHNKDDGLIKGSITAKCNNGSLVVTNITSRAWMGSKDKCSDVKNESGWEYSKECEYGWTGKWKDNCW